MSTIETTAIPGIFSEEEREQLVVENLKLIYSVAHKFAATVPVAFDELSGVAMEGFTRALNTYDDGRCAKFTTYATSCMNRNILYFLRSQRSQNRFATVSWSELSRGKNEMGDSSMEDALLYKKMLAHGDDTNNVETGFQKAELEQYLREKLDSMGKDSSAVLIMHYGLFGKAEHTQQEIADYLGISQSKVSKLEKKALDEFGKAAFMDYCKNEEDLEMDGRRKVKRVVRTELPRE